MSLNANELQALVERMLEEGIPPSVVARVFDLDDQLVKDVQKTVRVKKYGTDDLADYMEQMQWDAIESAREMLATGSKNDRIRIMNSALGKQMTAANKRTPEGIREQREKVEKMLAAARGDV